MFVWHVVAFFVVMVGTAGWIYKFWPRK